MVHHIYLLDSNGEKLYVSEDGDYLDLTVKKVQGFKSRKEANLIAKDWSQDLEIILCIETEED